MTTTTMESPGGFSFRNFYLILLSSLIIILAVVIGTSLSHGSKHATYPQAIKCFNDGKYILNFFDSGNRYIQFCMISKSTFAIRVLDKVADGQYEEVTAYIQKSIKSLEELEKFVLRRGYTIITKLP